MKNRSNDFVTKHSESKPIISFLLAALLLIGTAMSLGSAPAEAATCRKLSVYTDYHLGKPTLLIYNGGTRPSPKQLKLYYNKNLVPSPSDWGVRTDAPQFENRSGWYGYFIASRWYYLNWGWNDDWRWSATYCN